MKGMKDIKCSLNLWVFQVLLAGIVYIPLFLILEFIKNLVFDCLIAYHIKIAHNIRLKTLFEYCAAKKEMVQVIIKSQYREMT